MSEKQERMLHVNSMAGCSRLEFHARPPPLQSHSSHKMRSAEQTAGRGSRNQGLQTRLRVLWVIAVSGGDLKQCSRVSTTFSRECDRLSKFDTEKGLIFLLTFEKYVCSG